MRLGGPLHRFWLWWLDVGLPVWPWRVYCAVKGHNVTDDQCGRPEHRFCVTCSKGTPGAPVAA